MSKLSSGAIASAALFFFAVDRGLKLWFFYHPDFRRDVFVGLLSWHVEVNAGVAFGLVIPVVLLMPLLLTVLVGLVIATLRAWRRHEVLPFSALILVLSGAASNVIDRLRYGYVIDYIDVPFFTVFNLADVLISCGVSVLILDAFFHRPAKNPPAA